MFRVRRHAGSLLFGSLAVTDNDTEVFKLILIAATLGTWNSDTRNGRHVVGRCGRTCHKSTFRLRG